MTPSPTSSAPDSQTVRGWIEDFLRNVGVKDLSPDKNGWHSFRFADRQGWAGVVQEEDRAFLRVDALLMPLPSDKELLLPLYREMLEVNHAINITCRLSVRDERVWACDIRRIEWLDAGKVASAVDETMRFAQRAAQRLTSRYGSSAVKRPEPDDSSLA